jgi:hypothetical protein
MKNISGKIIALTIGLCVLSFGHLTKTSAKDEDNQMQTIRLVERISNFTFIDEGAAGPSLGDRLVFTSDLFKRDGEPAGRDGADCLVVRIDQNAPPDKQQIVQCTISVELENGQITFQGLAQGTVNTFAVTGGTGAFRAARGEALAVDRIPLQEGDITIRLVR